jgi:4-hydroxyphenylpyruvate dioxygenase
MRKAIATVSMSGTLREKLEAIAAARFDGYELFENDLLYFNGSPAEVRAIADDLGLVCDLYQPFRDFEAVSDALLPRNLDRAERKFDVMQALGARLMLVCSNTASGLDPDMERMAAQLYELAERAKRRNLRIGYEALAWGRVINLYSQAWSIVKRANHPHLGLILDSFHTLSLRDDPSGIAAIPGEKIFFMQLADAPLLAMDVLQWARHYRCFPGQGQFDLENFLEQVLLAGYIGPLSLEIFNDLFREAPARRTAADAMRSLLYLEGQVRGRLEAAGQAKHGANEKTHVLERIELFDPPAVPSLSGFSFLEFAVDERSGRALEALLHRLGFRRAGRHRSKQVVLYRQGDVNLILNADPNSAARTRFVDRGPSVCAIGLRTDDPVRALNRATALQCVRFDSPIGPRELQIPAIRAPDGSLVYFVPADLGSNGLFEIDFDLEADDKEASAEAGLLAVDHIAFGLPEGELDTWVLFCRAVLNMKPGDSLELSDPYGLIRSCGVASQDRSVRLVLNVSLSQRTRTARTVSTIGGGSVHHIALGCTDIFAAVAKLRANGVEFVPISPNYHDDLLARLDIDAGLVERLRSLGILYDRSSGGEYFHIYSASFADRFFFEIVQRAGGYDAYGALNAPARMASQAQAATVGNDP